MVFITLVPDEQRNYINHFIERPFPQVRPVFNFAPSGENQPPGVKLAPRGEVGPQGRSWPPRDEVIPQG
jgi:hypothetical protein